MDYEGKALQANQEWAKGKKALELLLDSKNIIAGQIKEARRRECSARKRMWRAGAKAWDHRKDTAKKAEVIDGL